MAQALKKVFAGAIRPVQPADLDAVMIIEQESFPADEAYDRDLMNEYLEASLANPRIPMLIAAPESDAKGPAGYTLGEIERDGTGEIISLAVTKAYAGQGLGRELLDRVSKSLLEAGANKLVLQVRVDNASAIHLYETSGFVKKKILREYYADGTDGFEMVKKVPKQAKVPRKKLAVAL